MKKILIMVLLALGMGSTSLLTPAKTNNLNNSTTFKTFSASTLTPTQAGQLAVAYGNAHNSADGYPVTHIWVRYVHTQSDHYNIDIEGYIPGDGAIMNVNVFFDSTVQPVTGWYNATPPTSSLSSVSSLTPTQAAKIAVAYGNAHNTYEGEPIYNIQTNYVHTLSDHYNIDLAGKWSDGTYVIMNVNVMFSDSSVQPVTGWYYQDGLSSVSSLTPAQAAKIAVAYGNAHAIVTDWPIGNIGTNYVHTETDHYNIDIHGWVGGVGAQGVTMNVNVFFNSTLQPTTGWYFDPVT